MLLFDVFVPTSVHPLIFLDKWFVQIYLNVNFEDFIVSPVLNAYYILSNLRDFSPKNNPFVVDVHLGTGGEPTPNQDIVVLNASYLGTRFIHIVKELSKKLNITFQQALYTNMCN